MPYSVLLYLLVSTLMLSTGCASTPVANFEELDDIASLTTEFSGDSERALAEAESKHDAALNAEMAFYAPFHMAQAEQTLTNARGLELNGLQQESLKASAHVIMLLNRATENKSKVQQTLKPLLKQKQVLETLNSPIILPDQFERQITKIKELIKNIESSDKPLATDTIMSILEDLQQLELDTLLTTHWLPAKNTLEKARNENAEKFAPKSFMKAANSVDQAKTFIRNNINDREAIKREGLQALRTAQHALYIAHDAELLVDLTNQTAETVVLGIEDLLAKISLALNIENVKHMALTDQANAIAQAAETQRSRLIAPLQARIIQLEKQLELLMSDKSEDVKLMSD